MQRSQCDSPATVQCNGDCNAAFCAEHDRSAHSNESLALHQRRAVAQSNSSNIASLSGASGSSSHDESSNAASATSSPATSSAPVAADTAAASASGAAVAEVRYVGERDEQGRAHGFGCEVDAKGRMIAERCGVWSQGLLLEGRSVPLSLMPEGMFTQKRARGAVLLRDEDDWYRGSLDEKHCAHGDGSWLEQVGLVTVERSGSFNHGDLPSGTLRFPNGVTFVGELDFNRPNGAGVLSRADGASFRGEWSMGRAVSGEFQLPPGASDDKKEQPIAAARYVGELDPLDLPHGIGCEVDAKGKMVAGRSGEWLHGLLVEYRAVPLSLMPADLFAEERARGAVLLCANGGWHRGAVNDRFYAHGDGISFPTFGLITIECIGRFDHSELPSGTLLYPNAISYVGELQDLRPHGTGVLTHPDGRSFKGEWINDKSVSGELRLAPASRCSAFFGAGEQKKDVRFIGERDPLDLPHGMGCEVDAAGKIIPRRCGRWIHGSLALETFVPLSLLPPDTFVEERVRGALLLWPHGVWYRGELDSDHLPHGEGCMFFADGRVKEGGSFDHGQLTRGFHEWPNGDTYDGEVKDGQPHGGGKRVRKSDGVIDEGTWSEGGLVSGECTLQNGRIWRGTFLNGWLHGPACVIVFSDGDRYEGDMQHGEKHGLGKYSWNDGETYEGQWAKDVQSGFGVQRRRDRTILQCGLWAEAKFIKSSPVHRSSLVAGTLAHADDTILFGGGARSAFDRVATLTKMASPSRPQDVTGRLVGFELSCADWKADQVTLGLQRQPNGDVYEGQLVNLKPKGFGALWNAEGKLLKCGDWGNGWLRELDSRPVPRRFIPFGEKLTAASREASLFYPNGDYFVGPLNWLDQPNSEGTIYSAVGAVKQQGVWSDGVYVGPALRSALDVVVDVASSSLEVASPEPAVAMDVDTSPAPKPADALLPEIPPASAMSPTAPPRRRSLLSIGINNYTQPGPQSLGWCWTDAERMHNAMLQLKFDSSTVRTDLDYSSLNREIDGFIASLVQQQYRPGDLAVLYYSGHGCEVGTNNVCLLPTDIGDEDGDYGGLSVHMLKRRFNRALSGVQVVFILDCCRVVECPTVNLNALIEQAQEQAHADQCAAETRRADKEQATMRRLRRQQEAEERAFNRDHDDAASEQSEPSYSLSSSSSLPLVRPQTSIPPHADDLTRNSFAVVYSCDSGHSAFPDATGGSVFTSALIDQIGEANADLSLIAILQRTNKQMRQSSGVVEGEFQSATAEISPTESITLAAERAVSA